MTADGEIDLTRIEPLAKRLIADGVYGVFVCGTTGESLSLTMDERMRVVEEWSKWCDDELTLFVHVGHNSLGDAQRLAQHAQEVGADAISAMPPVFFRPRHAHDLVDFCGELASAAPDLPFYYYHIPVMTGVDVPMIEFLKIAEQRIPTLAGIKFTHENLMDFGRCVRYADEKYDMLFGRDEILLAGLAMGARGAVGSTYNFAAGYYHAVIEAFNSGDLDRAQMEQARAMELIAAFAPYGGLPAQKAIMRMVGLECGPVRMPLRDLSPKDFCELRDRLTEIGFLSEAGPSVTSSGMRHVVRDQHDPSTAKGE